MKYIISLLVFLIVSVSSFSLIGNTCSANSLFNNTTNEIPYCKGSDCGLDNGIKEIKDIKNLQTTGTAATYATKVVKYLITFVYLIAVILIIYAGFNLLTGVGDEEKAKKSKTMIIYVIIGIALIFLAGPIIKFVMSALS